MKTHFVVVCCCVLMAFDEFDVEAGYTWRTFRFLCCRKSGHNTEEIFPCLGSPEGISAEPSKGGRQRRKQSSKTVEIFIFIPPAGVYTRNRNSRRWCGKKKFFPEWVEKHGNAKLLAWVWLVCLSEAFHWCVVKGALAWASAQKFCLMTLSGERIPPSIIDPPPPPLLIIKFTALS